MAAPNLW